MNGLIERVYAGTSQTFNFNIFALKNTQGNVDIGTVIGAVSGLITIVAAVIAFAFFIYSGFLYLTANGNPDQAKKGQQGIVNAIIGLIIIALAYIILRVVSTSLGGTSNDLNTIN